MIDYVDFVRTAVRNATTPWVLFSGGTVVFLPGQVSGLESLARETLTGWGAVQAGSPSGDFRVVSVDGGWFVGCHHPDILTVVRPEEMSGDSPSDVEVGLLGREKRDKDAGTLIVLHVQEGQGEPEPDTPPLPRSDNPRLASCQDALAEGDPGPMTEFLLDGDAAMTLEDASGGMMVHRESKVALFLPDPWSALYLERRHYLPNVIIQESSRGLEVRRRGPLYFVTGQPIQDFDVRMVVTGIEHTGRMSGAAAQALVQRYGAEVESEAREELAGTDRSLGTVVMTKRPPPPYGSPYWFGHVVSTPKYTPDSPGWLEKAMRGILDTAVEYQQRDIALVALGTNGGIDSGDAARLMIGTCQEWFHGKNVRMRLFFSLTDPEVRRAFEEEFRRRKLFFV